MRGIEAALKILGTNGDFQKSEKFATERLRKLASDEKMKSQDISLASSLIYIVMRRRELWLKIATEFLKNDFNELPKFVQESILAGTGGLLELRRFSTGVLVNGIVENLRAKKLVKYVSLVNAVLRNVNESGAHKLDLIKTSSKTDERAMYAGIPVWSIPAWLRTWNKQELNQIFEFMLQSPESSLRVSPSENIEELANKFGGEISKLSGAIHIKETVNPIELEGFQDGKFTVQSESSILTASIVRRFYDKNGLILDMCSGRGVKAGQILQENPDANLECWELSEKRQKSALNELTRLKVINRANFKTGNALELEPEQKPSFVILDSPCSCSGTWNRKPESKWRLSWENLDKLIFTQKKLLDRAVNLCAKGGYVLYITCSLLKQENENVIAEILSKYQDSCVEVSSLLKWQQKPFRKGKPWGIYIMPETAWLDGFYSCLILKK